MEILKKRYVIFFRNETLFLHRSMKKYTFRYKTRFPALTIGTVFFVIWVEKPNFIGISFFGAVIAVLNNIIIMVGWVF